MSVVCKSVFSIHPFDKKSVSVGFLIGKKIRIVILLECKLTRQSLQLDLDKWEHLLDDDNFSMMLNKIYTQSKRVTLCDKFSYSSNIKNETITLQNDKSRITLTRYSLLRLKEIQFCVNMYILKKQSELNLYQPCFDLMYLLLKRDIQDLPSSCQVTTFLSTYIHNYEFDLNELCLENRCFILEVQQFHHEKLADELIYDLILNKIV